MSTLLSVHYKKSTTYACRMGDNFVILSFVVSIPYANPTAVTQNDYLFKFTIPNHSFKQRESVISWKYIKKVTGKFVNLRGKTFASLYKIAMLLSLLISQYRYCW